MEQRLSETNSFDFDIGYLVKSPCRDCDTREDLPECIQGCEILDQIQAILAYSIPVKKAYQHLKHMMFPQRCWSRYRCNDLTHKKQHIYRSTVLGCILFGFIA